MEILRQPDDRTIADSDIDIRPSSACQSQIRAEEMYREELRKQLTPKATTLGKTIAFFNSPFGIYLLSSILLSGITFLYSRHRDEMQEQQAQMQMLGNLDEELVFRERQVDDSLKNCISAIEQSHKTDAKIDYSASAMSMYRLPCEELVASIHLSGMVFPPGDANGARIRYRNLTLDTNLLPYRQGYKFPDYKYLTFLDIGVRRMKVFWRHRVPQRLINDFQRGALSLDESAYQLLNQLDSSHQTAVDLDPFVQKVQENWESLMRSELAIPLEALPGNDPVP